MAKTVEARLELDRKCKNSVLFKAANSESTEVITGLYLMNKSFKALGEPEDILVTVTSPMAGGS